MPMYFNAKTKVPSLFLSLSIVSCCFRNFHVVEEKVRARKCPKTNSFIYSIKKYNFTIQYTIS
jgi:hypothetical protein